MLCPICGHKVEVNGIGPKNNPKLTWFLQTVFKRACKLFHEASRHHDLRYHIYGYSKQRADREFLMDMLSAIKKEKPNWFLKRWYKLVAYKFYTAVKLGGNSSYEESQKKCLANQGLL